MAIDANINKYNAIALGVLNGESFSLAGGGEIDVSAGRVVGLYEIETLKGDVDKLFFNAVLITGYPSVCKMSGDVENPFCAGGYSYRREVRFSNGDRIAYAARCLLQEGARTLHSFFDVHGSLPTVRLKESLPLTELWEPREDGQINGSFEMTWRCTDGSLISGQAKTVYSPTIRAAALTAKQKRTIRLVNSCPSASTFAVDQESDLCPDVII